jgi:hypothetical protein
MYLNLGILKEIADSNDGLRRYKTLRKHQLNLKRGAYYFYKRGQVFLKNVNVIKDKGRLYKCSKLKKPKDTGQSNKMCPLGLYPSV